MTHELISITSELLTAPCTMHGGVAGKDGGHWTMTRPAPWLQVGVVIIIHCSYGLISIGDALSTV